MNSHWRPGPLGRHGGAVVSDIAPSCSLVRLHTSPLPPSMESPDRTAAEERERPHRVADRPVQAAGEADLRRGGVQGPTVDEQAEEAWYPRLSAQHGASEELALDLEQQILGFGAEHRRHGRVGGAFGQGLSQAVGEIAPASDDA